VDAVLLTHGDIAHLGALPSAFARCGLRKGTPLCCTTPVAKLGLLALYELYAARRAEEDFAAFSLDEADAAFASVVALKYTQTLTLKPRAGGGAGVSVCAFPAGHSLGGAVWRLSAGAEEVLYASQWNNRQERHLPPAALGTLGRPSLLIAHCSAARLPPALPRLQRERQLAETLVAGALSGGLALLPCSCVGRSLELALALEAHWQAESPRLSGVRLVLLSAVSHSLLEFAATQLEWMSEEVQRRFERERTNPFAPASLRHLQPITSLKHLDSLPPGPTVVIASLSSLAAGPSRQLLARCAPVPSALLALPRLTSPCDTPQLVSALSDAALLPAALRPLLPLQLGMRQLLDGEELAAWREARQREQADAEAAAEIVEAQAVVQAATFRSDADADAMPAAAPLTSAGANQATDVEALQLAAPAPVAVPAAQRCLIDGFAADSKAFAPMFPFPPRPVVPSEYGELITAEDFADAQRPGGGATALYEEDTAPTPVQHSARPREMDGGVVAPAGADAGAPPTKLVQLALSLPLLCTIDPGVVDLDFSGLADGRSVRNTLQQLQPRRCLLVGGTAEDRDALVNVLGASACAPQAGERVDCSGLAPSLLMRMHPQLADAAEQALQSAGTGAYQVCWLDGVLDDASGSVGELPLLAPVPAAGGHAGARVGDARLSDLLAACAAAGIPAQFSAGGVLLAPGSVSVRKAADDDQQLLLEGPLGDSYFRMKEVIEQQWRLL